MLTGTEADPAAVVTELKTMPQIRSTQVEGVPDCAAWSRFDGSVSAVTYGQKLNSSLLF
jgi:hypothetical protein